MIGAYLLARYSVPIVVTRRTQVDYTDDGKRVVPTTASITIQAVIVPLDQQSAIASQGRELDRTREGRTNREFRKLFSPTALKVADDVYDSDLLAVDGTTWEVVSVKNWSQGSFYECVIQEQ